MSRGFRSGLIGMVNGVLIGSLFAALVRSMAGGTAGEVVLFTAGIAVMSLLICGGLLLVVTRNQ